MLTLGLSALNVGAVFSSSEVSLNAELKPSFPGDGNGSSDNADRVDGDGIGDWVRNTLKWARNRFCAVSVLLQVETRQVNQRCYSHICEDNLV